ncbi:unnamed protein product [Onchocerca ochengi]|uniref:Transposase n=2 Tax=Onchocerca TaxID=6281 RepID=A0A182EGG3_ONCOC|nr:unnamed protein product [Onchocerca ochengi]
MTFRETVIDGQADRQTDRYPNKGYQLIKAVSLLITCSASSSKIFTDIFNMPQLSTLASSQNVRSCSVNGAGVSSDAAYATARYKRRCKERRLSELPLPPSSCFVGSGALS